jgi:chitosanase
VLTSRRADGEDLLVSFPVRFNAFLDARVAAMKTEAAHSDTSRVDTARRVFLNNRNFARNPPLSWKVYGDPYYVAS